MHSNRWIQTLVLLAGIMETSSLAKAGTIVDFEDVFLPSSNDAGDFYNGSDLAGNFVSQGVDFNNSYDTEFNSWSGWAASNSADSKSAGCENQYSAFPASGADGSEKFGVAHNFMPGDSVISFSQPTEVTGTYLTNGTYAAQSMLQGDPFAKKFGGTSGNDPDWFKLAIFGKDLSGNTTGTVDFYLADFRFGDSSQDYVVEDWAWVDLTSLGTQVQSLEFELSSSDNHPMFGMNTPAFFLIDNLSITVPDSEPPENANFNGDTTVDGADLIIWKQNFGMSSGATTQLGDADGDEDVDGRDFLIWQRQFDVGGPSSQFQTVPEPATTGMLCWIVAILARRSKL